MGIRGLSGVMLAYHESSSGASAQWLLPQIDSANKFVDSSTLVAAPLCPSRPSRGAARLWMSSDLTLLTRSSLAPVRTLAAQMRHLGISPEQTVVAVKQLLGAVRARWRHRAEGSLSSGWSP